MAFMDYLFGKSSKTKIPNQILGSILGPLGGEMQGLQDLLGGKDFLFGKSAKTKTKPIYDPEQENLLNQILGSIQGPLGSGIQNLQNILGGDEEQFEAFQRPARRHFEQQTLPTIAERFTGTFGEGSQRSSAFGQALGTAGRELEENLASKRIGMQGNALSQLLQLMGPALKPRRYQYQRPREPGFLENIGVALAGAAPQLLPLLL